MMTSISAGAPNPWMSKFLDAARDDDLSEMQQLLGSCILRAQKIA
jgi:hypothetical protein